MSEGCLVTPVSLVVKSRPTNPPKNTDPRPISKQPHASAWQGLNEVKDAASSCKAAVQPKHLDGNLSKEKGSQTFKQASPSASACKTCEAKCQVMYHILKYMDIYYIWFSLLPQHSCSSRGLATASKPSRQSQAARLAPSVKRFVCFKHLNTETDLQGLQGSQRDML